MALFFQLIGVLVMLVTGAYSLFILLIFNDLGGINGRNLTALFIGGGLPFLLGWTIYSVAKESRVKVTDTVCETSKSITTLPKGP